MNPGKITNRWFLKDGYAVLRVLSDWKTGQSNLTSPSGIPFGSRFWNPPAIRIRKPAGAFILAVAAGTVFLVPPCLYAESLSREGLSGVSIAEPAEQGNQQPQDLIQTLQKGNPYDKQRAAISLGNARDKSAVEPLIQALRDADDFVRDFSAKALGEIGDPRAMDPLIQALGDGHDLVRRSAALALGNLRDPRAVDPLIKALDGGSFLLRRAAAKALGQIGDAIAVDPLIRALASADVFIQNGAANALTDIGDPAVSRLVNLLADWTMGPRAAEVLQALNWQPATDAEKVRLHVALRNGQLLSENWKVAKEVLVNDANSTEIPRSMNAVLALISIGRDEVVEELVGVLGTKGSLEMARVFSACGNPRLLEAARDWARKREAKLEEGAESAAVKWGAMKSD